MTNQYPQTFINKDQVDSAIKLIQKGPDNSEANKVARQVAKKRLLEVAQYFGDFANLKPGSLAGIYLNERAVELRKIAATVELG